MMTRKLNYLSQCAVLCHEQPDLWLRAVQPFRTLLVMLRDLANASLQESYY